MVAKLKPESREAGIYKSEDGASIEIVLNTPVEIDGKKSGMLTMREPTAKDIFFASKGANNDEAVINYRLMNSLCGLTSKGIDNLKFKDLKLLMTAYQSFLS
jgi:hypothetical protein